MASFSGRFEYLAPGRGALRSGGCTLSFDERTVTIVGDGPPLAFDLGDIDAYEAGEFDVRLSLFDGHGVVLSRFAKAFRDMERQLREAYRDRLVQCLLVSDLDEVARFAGRVQIDSPRVACDGSAEIRLYESNLAVLPDSGTGFQWRLADIDRVEFDETAYTVTFTNGAERLTAGRLAKRTGELAERVRSRIGVLHERAARSLRNVFPFLGPEEFSRLASVMREGGSASMSEIGPLHRLVEPTLLESVVDSGLSPYVAALAARAVAPWFAGYKVVRTEAADERDGEGEAGEAGEPSPTHETSVSLETASTGDRGVAERLAVGDRLELLFWFFFPIAADGKQGATHIAWEATSRGGRATYVFRLPAGESAAAAVAAVNRGLVSLNFRREPVYLDERRLETDHRYRHYAIALRRLADLRRVRDSFAGRAIHTSPDAWAAQLDRLLRG
jgi:hypothetical protein